MEKFKALDAYLALNVQELDGELILEIKKAAQMFDKLFVLTKKAFMLSFWQQYAQQIINLEEFIYLWDFSRDNLGIWESWWKLEWMYFLWGLFLSGSLSSNTGYIIDKLSLKVFRDKHDDVYQRLTKALRLKNSEIIAI